MEKQGHIPTEAYVDFLGRTIEIHWNYHAILMVLIWFVLVPICVISLRYYKPRPTKEGITVYRTISRPEWVWFHIHQYGLNFAIFMSLAGMTVALAVSGGISGSVHSVFGLSTIGLGVLQGISAYFRGSHGGRYYNNADQNDPKAWEGDHFSMTARRRRMESYHKTAGFFTMACAVGAVGSGLMQFPMPILAGVIIFTIVVLLAVSIYREHKGKRYDTYRAVFGNDLEHPYNKEREDL
ncbi:cytochrome b561 domain-containing protein [Sulfitobacter sp.]|uniref:cytochrome b561 domain-containing protein n=1 Tax=Sulfitobacter sp. TaxID=1903071 RepID=UPI0030014614